MAGQKSSASIDKALLLVRSIIERLRNPPVESFTEDDGFKAFFVKQLGAVRMSGKTLQQYGGCLDALVALHAKNPSVQLLSRNAAEHLLQTAMLRALRPKKASPQETRATFKRRLDREIANLRKRLLGKPRAWIVTIQVRGFSATALALSFGGVRFMQGTAAASQHVASVYPRSHSKGRRATKKVLAAEQRVAEEDVAKISAWFAEETVATVTVHAFDPSAARAVGIERIRRTIDILNFFAPNFDIDSRSGMQRAFVAPEGKRISLPSLVCQADGGNDFGFISGNPSPNNRSIVSLNPDSEKGRSIGLARVSEMLAREQPSDLEIRILTALSWAGRATVAQRRDEAFLLFAVALEALLCKPKTRSGVTDRLRLRVSWLIGVNADSRKRLFVLVGKLYDIRNSLAHAGDSSDLTDSDLELMDWLVTHALSTVLTDKRFVNIRTAAQFEQWLDDQLFVSEDSSDSGDT